MARGEDGTTTVFMLGLCVAILFLGGLSLDFWHVLAERRTLAAMADAAAAAGANGLDEASARDGVIALDPGRAQQLAYAELRQESEQRRITGADVVATRADVVVRLHGTAHFSLLSIFLGNGGFAVEVSASATPRRVP
jgi:Flp pilus assembly protein TadG